MTVGTRPARALVDLAAGRDPGDVDADGELIAQAIEHRMTGLLCTHLRDRGAGDLNVAMLDLRIQAHQAQIRRLLDLCLDTAEQHGVEVIVLKGASIEHRFYGRAGERPSSDVDLWMLPHDRRALVGLVAALQPDHPWLSGLDRMVARRQIQSVTLQVDDLEVDVHVDPLKLGVWTRQAGQAWASTQEIALEDGRPIRVLSDDWTLLLLLIHLSKDRFQRLLGYADVVRIMRGGDATWERVLALARGEGIEHLAEWAMDVIEADLGVRLRPEVQPTPPRLGLRSWIWHRLWRPDIRMRGSEGRRRFRFRQNILPLLGKGRVVETLRWWLREVFPPAPAVAAEYPDEPGPYCRRLVLGRIKATRARRRMSEQPSPVTRQGRTR
ncbi:MAG: nucleotidyltransferase family protein [Nitriliruptoraceae bacterium]|nr:nucleotidyltransferase family protein [Nitriliruptoraceae bacterium]